MIEIKFIKYVVFLKNIGLIYDNMILILGW